MNGLLFIDDEEGIRHSVTRALKRSAYTVHTAINGSEGVALVKETPHGISTVISDYKMPGLNGLETLYEIRCINPEITRIILTGYATMDVAIEATNEGIDGFLTKPFDNAEFRAKIHEICLRKRLRQFISEPVYRKIQQVTNALQPTFHEVSVLFADIRNFTRLTGGASPQAIARFLNDRFFAPMGEIAFRYNGTIDKHIGDSVMVVFGSPVADDEDPQKAVLAAMEMQLKARKIDELLLEQGDGLRLEIGIGIATGEVFSGVLGSLRKKEFTSVGMAVNLASRLQDMAAGGEIIISEETYQKIKKTGPSGKDATAPLKAQALPPVRVKGIVNPITVYAVKY
jgi:class 3 adenylate cyclase